MFRSRLEPRAASAGNDGPRVGPELARIRFVNSGSSDVRGALIRQWQLIADAVEAIDLSAASRVAGWTNRAVLAHLYVQPHLVARFLHSEPSDTATLGLAENLSATRSYGALIDAAAREGAALNKVELATPWTQFVLSSSPLDWRPRSPPCKVRSRFRTISSRDASRPSCTDAISSLRSLQIPTQRPSPPERFWTPLAPQLLSWSRRHGRFPWRSGSMSPPEEQGRLARWQRSCRSWRSSLGWATRGRRGWKPFKGSVSIRSAHARCATANVAPTATREILPREEES